MMTFTTQLDSDRVDTPPRFFQHPPSHLQRSPEESPADNTPPTTTDATTVPRKYRTPRDVAKKLFEQAISSSSSSSSSNRRRPISDCPPTTSAMISGTRRVMGGGNSGIPSHASSVQQPPQSPGRAETRQRSSTVGSNPRSIGHLSKNVEKPQASSSSGALTMTIQLAEPIMFLQGLDQAEYDRTPAMLRGSLTLKVAKPTKIRAVTLTFRGRARTEWPEGIPPKKSEYFEEKEIMQHTWPFFNAQFPTAELGHCADSFYPRKYSAVSDSGGTRIGSAISHLARSASPIGFSPASSSDKLGLQLTQSRSFSRGESPNGNMSVAQRGYRIFQPGEYIYNFEMPLDSCLPETIDVELGSVKYELDGCIERPGAFRPNLTGKKEVTVVRVPSEANLEASEPISISRTWEDQLHYDIVISGKSFPLGTSIPITFKLTPLAKVRCHRIKILITENVSYYCKNKKFHRLDPTKKLQLYEKRAESLAVSTFEGSSVRVTAGGGAQGPDRNDVVNGTDNLLGDLTGSPNVGPTEMEFNVQLPGCGAKERDRIHFDTTYQNIQVHHWIKIVMRLSKQDPNNPSKRRHFEISIDSPFHILSCKATRANTTLPAYGAPQPASRASGWCLCPQPQVSRRNPSRESTNSSLALVRRPSNSSQSDTQPRPHLTLYPSSNPPPFDADVAPPLITPPPCYETVVGNGAEGLSDYFSRLAEEDTPASDYDTDEESPGGTVSRRRRLLLPLTPGGRVARSMDEPRTWVPIDPV